MQTLQPNHISVMRDLVGGADIFSYADARLIRDMEESHPGLITITDAQTAQPDAPGVSRPYFGAILTKAGKKALKAADKKPKRLPKTNPVKLPIVVNTGLDPRMYNSAGQELLTCGDCSGRGRYWEWVDDNGEVHHRKGRNQHMAEGGKRAATKVPCRACKGAGVIPQDVKADANHSA